MKKIIIPLLIIVVLAVIGVGGWYAWNNQQKANASANYLSESIARGNLTSLIGATGSVRAAQTANLAWKAAGNASRINVREGDQVTTGQALANLDESNLPASIIAARADLASAQKQLENLQSSNLATLQAAQAISSTQKTLIEAQKIYAEKFDITAYQDKIDTAQEDVVKANDDLEEAEKDFEPYQDWDVDNETRKDYQDKVDEAQKKYDDAVRTYDLLVLDKSLAWQNVIVAQAQWEDAQQKYEDVKDGADPRDVAALQAGIDAAQATLDSVVLAAPFAGTITHVEAKNGDPVSPGQLAFRLDDLSHLFVDVRISEVDVNSISTGQDVRLSFDAVQGKEYTGRISEVSSVGVLSQGVVEFLVTIEVLEADEDVKPGMTAAVNIVVETLENVLLVPNRAVRATGGEYVVYVLEDNSLVMVTITLGANSDTYSEVIDGNLNVGDKIVLNPPTTFDTNGPPPFARR